MLRDLLRPPAPAATAAAAIIPAPPCIPSAPSPAAPRPPCELELAAPHPLEGGVESRLPQRV